MARINLLPWREEQRNQRKREFFFAVGGSVIFMLGIVLYVHMHIGGLIANQNSRNDYVKREIKVVEAKIAEISELEKQKEQLISRMRVIEQLQSNRPEIVHVFEEIAKLAPDGLYLVKLTQAGRNVTLEGVAQSNARVSSFMRALEESPWFTKPQLEVIQSSTKEVDRSRTFKLRVSQAGPGQES